MTRFCSSNKKCYFYNKIILPFYARSLPLLPTKLGGRRFDPGLSLSGVLLGKALKSSPRRAHINGFVTKHRKPEHRKSLSRQVIRSKDIKVEQPKHRKSKDRMDRRSNAQRRSKFDIASHNAFFASHTFIIS